MQWDEELNCEAADQADGDALEVVAFDKLIEIHTQHFKNQDQMLAEDKFLFDADDILFVFGVIVTQLLEDLRLDQSLLVEALFVSEDFKSSIFLILMIEALEDLAKAALAKPVDDLEAVADMLALLGDVLILVIVEAVVVHAVGRRRRALRRLPLVDVEPVNSIVVENFLLFDFHEVFWEIDEGSARVHGEFEFAFLVGEIAVAGLFDDWGEARGNTLLDPR